MARYSRYLLYCSSGCIGRESKGEEIYIQLWQPSLFRFKPKGARRSLFAWWIYYLPKVIHSKPSYEVFYVVNGERLIHYTVASHKCFKFPFMNDSDIQIGPSWTAPEYRNMNIATRVIDFIRENYSDGLTKFFWIVGEENHISRHLIEKLGFENCGVINRENALAIIPAPVYKRRDS